MSPPLTEDEIDDLIYFSRAGEKQDLDEALSSLATAHKVSPAEILIAAQDEGKSTCLHMATGNGHLDIVTSLLGHFADRPAAEKKAFLDAPNEYGNTALHWAAMNGHLAVVQLLVADGAAPALANDKNYVPLDLASLHEKVDVVDWLLGQAGGLEGENAGGLGEGVEGVDLEETDGNGDGEEAGGADEGKGNG